MLDRQFLRDLTTDAFIGFELYYSFRIVEGSQSIGKYINICNLYV